MVSKEAHRNRNEPVGEFFSPRYLLTLGGHGPEVAAHDDADRPNHSHHNQGQTPKPDVTPADAIGEARDDELVG